MSFGRRCGGRWQKGGRLLDGDFDEATAAASFQDAVRDWRQGRAPPSASGPIRKEPVAPDEPLKVGDEVQSRDYDEQSWVRGVVTSIAPLEVQPQGKSKSFAFGQVQRYHSPG